MNLLVFRNGDERDVLTVSKTPLRNPFEVDIAPVGKRYIWDHYRAYGGPKPPPIDHQGIDYSAGMASEVAYYYKGKWYWLQGAD